MDGPWLISSSNWQFACKLSVKKYMDVLFHFFSIAWNLQVRSQAPHFRHFVWSMT